MGIDTNIENLETSFEAAKSALEKSWNSIDAWNHLEEFAESSGFDKRVADVYRNSLKLTFDSKTFELIAKRAVDFFDEWFGDSDDVKDLLKQIVEISQASGHDGDWAFNRLTEMFFAAGEWNSVFNIYDSFLASTKDVDRKKQLLDEGANIARDMAELPEKALEYLLQLQELDRDNSSRLQTIERMLEKQERWDDLINLWNEQIPFMSAAQNVAARLNIADCYMYKLDKFDLAVTALDEILKISKGNEDAWNKLEYILSNETISSELRFKAMEILSASYKSTGNYSARVDVIKIAIDFIDDEEIKTDLLRKVASSLALINREEESIAHYGELLKISPSDGDAVKQIKLLSIKEKRHDLRAEALMNAGLATNDESLKIEHMGTAAQLFATELNDRKKAISIYSDLLELTDIESSLMLKTAHSLNDLLSLEKDHEQRLNVLEKIAELEPAKIVRRTVLQEAAKLAVNLDIPEKALLFWNILLDENENDIEALGAVISLHEQLESWENVIKYLLKRADSKILKEQRRSDLVKIAEIQINYLDDPEQAIATWHKVFNEFGPRKDAVEQLDQLLESKARFEDLAIILNKAVGGDFERLQQLNIRLGDIYIKLERPDTALEYYKKVINLNSNNELAIKALTELAIDDSVSESISNEVLQLLWECHKKNENWTALIEMLDVILESTEDLFNKTLLLKEAASVSENRLDDSELTFSILLNLISLTPDDLGVITRLENIAQQLEKWEVLADKFEEIATTLSGVLKIEILTKIAGIKELKLNNYSDALVVYSEIMKLKPADKVISDAVMRLAAKTGSFAVGIYAMMLHIENSGNIDEHLIKMFEASASALDEWEKLAATFESSLAQSEVNITLKSELYLRLAKWFMDYCKDKNKAISVLKKAVELSGTNIDALNMLSDIITVEESADYIKMQSALYAFNSDNLDPLFKSAKCAMDYIDEYEEKRTIVLKLYESASRLWTLGREATGEYSPGDCVLEAVTMVAALDLENNNPQKAAGFLMEGAKLPFDNARSIFMRNQAAALFAENGLTAVAIDVYNQILSYDPDNNEILEKLDALLEKDGRTLELMAIRQKRLDLNDDIDVKIKLRLDLAKLGGILEGSNARMQMLIENLNEIPGHKESLDSVIDLMMRRGVYNELVELLISQAEIISKTENSDYAARIFETAASIIKDKLH
ncbi:MAG: tetratricopeptide repeat protein, partial [Deltaproteobacteria bacterium]|nr:tetratricopeptide repeat protein [Deltaproteobacteria bacterium]